MTCEMLHSSAYPSPAKLSQAASPRLLNSLEAYQTRPKGQARRLPDLFVKKACRVVRKNKTKQINTSTACQSYERRPPAVLLLNLNSLRFEGMALPFMTAFLEGPLRITRPKLAPVPCPLCIQMSLLKKSLVTIF